MSETLKKSLTDLIDETLQELEELRKSRFSASEIKIEGPGDGIAGKPSDGDLHAKKGENEAVKAEDEKDEDEKHEEKESKAEEKAEHAKKAEMEKGVNDEAEKADKDEKKDDKKDKKDDKDGDKDDAKAAFAAMKKSLEDSDSLMKSYVEERVKPLEEKLTTILDLVNKIADQPVAPKGATARTPVTPLLKSGDAGFEPLSKAEVAGKLFELKKSGTKVDSLDITKAEMGQDLQQLIKKYEIS